MLLGGEDSLRALDKLCRRYWSPIFTYIRSRGHDHHEAEELVQDFISSLIHKGALYGVQRQKGRFRTFLLVCLKNFLSSRHEYQYAQKRGNGAEHCSLDTIAESVSCSVPAQDDVVFDRPWAETLLSQALMRIEEEYLMAGRREWFEDLKTYLTGEDPVEDRQDIALRHEVTIGAVDVGIHRLRRRYGVILRSLVAETVDSSEAVDAEMDYLISIIAS